MEFAKIADCGDEKKIRDYLRIYGGHHDENINNAKSALERIMYTKALNDTTLREAERFVNTFSESALAYEVWDYIDSVSYHHDRTKISRNRKYNFKIS